MAAMSPSASRLEHVGDVQKCMDTHTSTGIFEQWETLKWGELDRTD